MEFRHNANAVCYQSNAQIFWDSKGLAHSEFMRTGTNVISERYFEMLRKLKTRLRSHIEHPLIELDDARQHTSARSTAEIRSLGSTVLDHPSYRPDLAPPGFILSPKLEERLRGLHYRGRRTMKSGQLWFRHRNARFYREWHTKLLEHWKKCVDRQGDYVRMG